MVYANGTAHGFQLFAGGRAVFCFLLLHKADSHHLVVGFADPFQGFLPRILVHNYWLNLRGEKRPVGNRQHIHAPGHHLLGQGEAFAVFILADVFGHVLFEFLK